MSQVDAHGPIDTLIIQFPAGVAGNGPAAALGDLVEQGIVRLFDLVAVQADVSGTCTEIDLASADGGDLAAFAAFSGARSGLIGGDDLTDVAGVLDPGSTAIVVMYENAWAAPFVGAAFADGAQVVASSRITAQQIADALDAVDAD